jgi:hypothetical protein
MWNKILYVGNRSDMPSKWGVNFLSSQDKVFFKLHPYKVKAVQLFLLYWTASISQLTGQHNFLNYTHIKFKQYNNFFIYTRQQEVSLLGAFKNR